MEATSTPAPRGWHLHGSARTSPSYRPSHIASPIEDQADADSLDGSLPFHNRSRRPTVTIESAPATPSARSREHDRALSVTSSVDLEDVHRGAEELAQFSETNAFIQAEQERSRQLESLLSSHLSSMSQALRGASDMGTK